MPVQVIRVVQAHDFSWSFPVGIRLCGGSVFSRVAASLGLKARCFFELGFGEPCALEGVDQMP